MYQEEPKPAIAEETKSSSEILTELFSSFDVEPPLIIKKEKREHSKKHKKNKKKHRHKEKKHRRKSKKRSRSSSSENSEKHIKVKKEKHSPSNKIKAEDSYSGEDLTPEIKHEHLDTDGEFSPKIKREQLGSDEESASIVKCEIKSKNELNSEEKLTTKTSKIKIKSLEFSSIFAATIREIQEKQQIKNIEEGELQSSDETLPDSKSKLKRKTKHSHEKHKKKKQRTDSQDRSRSRSKKQEAGDSSSRKEHETENESKKSKHKDNVYKCKHKNKNGYNSDDYHNKDKSYKSSEKDSSYYKENYRSRSQDHEESRHTKRSENPFYKESDEYKHRERSPHNRDQHDVRWSIRDRYRENNSREDTYRRHTDSSRERDCIDKQKLLEIARKNAIQMMKSGNLPAALTLGRQAQEKVLAAIRAGGKTIKELTEFCKALSKKEESGELSDGSDNDERGSDNEHKAFHHPFQIKDRPSSIIMNIKNSVPLPIKSAQERSTELRLQFPVSSGSHHRKTENEWVPVSPKKIEAAPVETIETQSPEALSPLAIEAPPPTEESLSTPTPVENSDSPVFPPAIDPNIDIGQIVTQRLSAMRKLQENPYDVEALTTMHKSQKEMQNWAESKQVPGQFTGSTGANILSQAELASGYQAWAKKDQLQNAAPVSGGMGMHLLKKMGWNPGEGLGKDKTGALQPLLLEVKLDKKGLVANEEQKRKQNQLKLKAQKLTTKSLEGKHPVSLLGEFTAKRKLGAPNYTLCLESGPDHKKVFIFQVEINGLICKPDAPSPNKKQAKADAAKLCLQKLGILPVLPL